MGKEKKEKMIQVRAAGGVAGGDVIWHGRPRQGVFFFPLDALHIPLMFLISSLGLLAYWDSGNVLALGLVFIGGYHALGRFLWSAIRRRHLCYTIECDRVVVHFDLFFERSVVLPLADVEGVGVNCDGGKYGDLIFFGEHLPSIGWIASPGVAERGGERECLMLERIESVFEVASMIRELSGGRVWTERYDLVK